MKDKFTLAILAIMLAAYGAGCASREYVLGGQLPAGLHSGYERNCSFQSNVSFQIEGRAEKHTSEGSLSDNLRLVVVSVPESNERILLREITNRKYLTSITDGKSDIETKKTGLPDMVVEAVPIDLVGEASQPMAQSDLNYPAVYFFDKIFALPTKPMIVGEEWSMQLEEKGCRADVHLRLAKVENRSGKRVATVRGEGKFFGPDVEEPPGSKHKTTGELVDYTRELDLDSHITISERYTFRSRIKGESFEMAFMQKRDARLLKCETLDNEKWQPGISAFAKALADTNDPHKAISAMKYIIAFAGANRDTPIGEYLQWYLKFSGKVLGKNVWEILEFDKDAQWFNTGGLKKEDLAGKVFMLEFWATWCGPCTVAAPKIARLYDELAPQGFTVIGVSQDQDIKAEDLEAYLKNHGVKYPIYWDKTAKVTLSFDIEGIPHSVLVGRDGTILWEGMPYDEKFLRELILSVLESDGTKKPPEKNKTEGTAPATSSDKPANP